MKHLMLVLVLIGASAAPRGAADCDRDCLRGFITQYLDALVAHNPSALPLDAKVRFTEDSVEMHLGDGLWKDASRVRAYRQDVLDVRQGVAASQVIVEEAGSPALLVLRLKVANKKITEIETMVTTNSERRRALQTRCASDRGQEHGVRPRQIAARIARGCHPDRQVLSGGPQNRQLRARWTLLSPPTPIASRTASSRPVRAARVQAAKTSRRRKSWSIRSSPLASPPSTKSSASCSCA